MPAGDDDDIFDDVEEFEIEGNNKSFGDSQGCCTGEYSMKKSENTKQPVPESN